MNYRKGFSLPLILLAMGILVLVTGIGLFIQKRTVAPPPVSQITTEQTSPTPIPTKTQPVNTTDTQLGNDSSGIDASIKAIDTDAASIDAGLNDKMGDLSE